MTLAARSIVSLQAPHPEISPAERLRQIAADCERYGITTSDVYGDFHLTHTKSFLRSFERNVALELNKEDAVFMPSGVMAQQIALLIHSKNRTKKMFACHHSSHLLLHEEEGFRNLLEMEALIINTNPLVSSSSLSTSSSSSSSTLPNNHGLHFQCSVPPLSYHHVQQTIDTFKKTQHPSVPRAGDVIAALIVELPHRELGGKCTPWEELRLLRDLCHDEGMAFHCDGARLFEATTGYDSKTPAELTSLFDSVYLSFYKGLAGTSGAMLMGTTDFCQQARTWLRRFGGNLYTLLPYAVAGYSGYHRHWLGNNGAMTFLEKKEKLKRIVAALSADDDIRRIVVFDPPVPEVNMIHGYLRMDASEFPFIKERIENDLGICVLSRIRSTGKGQCMFEWTMGEANGNIDDKVFVLGWKALALELNRETKMTPW